jgi:predicted transcriptional regulator
MGNEHKVKSDIPENIIRLLIQFKTSTFTEMKNMLNVSNPVLSYHLKTLTDEKLIVFQKEGRKKHYKISKNILKKFDSRLTLISENHNMSFGMFLDVYEKDTEIMFTVISDMLSSMFLYTIIKGMQTGDNWFKGFDPKQMAEETLVAFAKIVLGEEHIKFPEIVKYARHDMNEFFKQINKIPDIEKKNKIDLLYKKLKERYPERVDYLELEAPEQIET